MNRKARKRGGEFLFYLRKRDRADNEAGRVESARVKTATNF